MGHQPTTLCVTPESLLLHAVLDARDRISEGNNGSALATLDLAIKDYLEMKWRGKTYVPYHAKGFDNE